jgi:ribosomal protein S18 acetylase RimI-like enzyme
MWRTDVKSPPLAAQTSLVLAEALGDTPETVIAGHLLRRGLGRAYLAGELPHVAAVVRNLAFDMDELMAFGTDPVALWALLRVLDGWSCVGVVPEIAPDLGALIGDSGTRAVRFLDDLYHVAVRPVPAISHPAVRLLTAADREALERVSPALPASGFGSAAGLLAHGIAAAAIIDARIVGLAHTSAQSVRYADLSVAVLPAYRGRGLATATAALVAGRLQVQGRVPVWSASENNVASLRIAAKLGFEQVARRTYVILDD